MSSYKENAQRKIAKDEWKEEAHILSAVIAESEDDTVIEQNTSEAGQEANRLAWVAIWVSVVAVVISAVSAAIRTIEREL